MHLDSSDESTITKDGSNLIEQWRDKSGNDNHVTQNDNTKKPLLAQNSLNGLPVIKSDGDDYLDTINSFKIKQIFAVFRNTNDTFAYSSVLGAVSGGRTFIFQNNNTILHWNPFPVSVRKNGTLLSSPFDLAPINTFMVLTVNTANPDNTRAYRTHASDNYFGQIEVAEILGYDRVLSTSEITQVESYLGKKWGIDI